MRPTPRTVKTGNSNIFKSVSVAFRGLLTIIYNEGGIKFILFCAISAIALSLYLKFGLLKVLLVSYAWLQVLIFEINNTAIELDIDYSSNSQYHPVIKKIKDYIAATVFLASCFAITITLIFIIQSLD